MNLAQELKVDIASLAKLIKPKVPNSEDALQYADVGEYQLALELLSDWCVDIEPEIVLSANEITQFYQISKKLKIEHPWVELLPLMNSNEIKELPSECIVLAASYINSSNQNKPEKQQWVNRIRTKLNLPKTNKR